MEEKKIKINFFKTKLRTFEQASKFSMLYYWTSNWCWQSAISTLSQTSKHNLLPRAFSTHLQAREKALGKRLIETVGVRNNRQ